MIPVSRSRLRALLVLLVAGCGPDASTHSTTETPIQKGPVVERHLSTLSAHRLAPHAYGRKGDVTLTVSGLRYTFATAQDAIGKKPLQGALLDADLGDDDREDAHLWLRPAWRGPDGSMHPLVAKPVATTCEGAKGTASEGVLLSGAVDGVDLSTTFCPEKDGTLRIVTTSKGLPQGAKLADDLGPGPTPVVLDHGGANWEGTRPFAALALAGPKSTLVLRPLQAGTGPSEAIRTLVHIAKETFPSPVALVYEDPSATRSVRVTADGPAKALGKTGIPAASGSYGLSGVSGTVTFLDDSGEPFATTALPPEGLAIPLPLGFAKEVVLRDAKGVVCIKGPFGSPELAHAKCSRNARLGFTVHADEHVAAPFHAIVHGELGTSDPELLDLVPQGGKLRSVSSKNSIYSLDGRAEVELRPGKYHVLVTRGPGSTLDERHIVLGPDDSEDIASEIRNVLPKDAFAADFHLHAAPSPDSTVSLAERMVTLASESVSFAVASDHNRVTDYRTAKAELAQVRDSLFPELAVGDEITSGGSRLYGHFNAFPLAPLPAGVAPEDYTIPYFGVAPKDLFSGARRAGAAIVQVNHPRMPPKIGYFDQTSLDPKTGAAGAEFADDFDAVEAHNGIWLESPDRVHEGFQDIVALARRGKLVAATGNSDSHKLFLEEPGYPRTYVFLPKGEGPIADRVVSAVRARNTVVSSGPYLEATLDGALPGSVVAPKTKSAKLRIRVTAPAWIPVEEVSILVDGEVKKTFAVTAKPKNGVRFEAEWSWAVTRDATLAVWVESKAPLPRVLHEKDARAIAFTTPFYVDADGDGKITLTR